MLFAGLVLGQVLAATGAAAPGNHRAIDLAPAWSGHPVNFALLTRGETQFVAFYDERRQMTVAQRRLGQTAWRFKKLPSHVEWDSHNALMLGLDR
ncbi:MAG: alginate lyase, partial [Verrucomicrobia bacterium]|nr:alginate lyase [Verrucomicrobiota bacterium]